MSIEPKPWKDMTESMEDFIGRMMKELRNATVESCAQIAETYPGNSDKLADEIRKLKTLG